MVCVCVCVGGGAAHCDGFQHCAGSYLSESAAKLVTRAARTGVCARGVAARGVHTGGRHAAAWVESMHSTWYAEKQIDLRGQWLQCQLHPSRCKARCGCKSHTRGSSVSACRHGCRCHCAYSWCRCRSQEVVWRLPLHLCDAAALGCCVLELHYRVVHVLVNVHDGRLVAAPAQQRQAGSGACLRPHLSSAAGSRERKQPAAGRHPA